jgi:5-(carboxyamino)imidazole ribonucleotide mutase
MPPAPQESPRMKPLVFVVMGSRTDWEAMAHCAQTLRDLGVPYEAKVMSAHRTPAALHDSIGGAEARGVQVVIAASGGAAHLAGVCASLTTLPVLGVPMESKMMGLDSLLSTAQMPGGVPVGTLAVGRAGAINAAILAAQIIGLSKPEVREAVRRLRAEQAQRILGDAPLE